MLNAWPITPQETSVFVYDGSDPDFASTNMLDGIGDCLQRATYPRHLANELVDPFVFMQFVMGLQDALASKLADAATALKGFKTAQLDAYDRSDMDALEEETYQRLFALLDQQFQDLIAQGNCTYGTYAKSAEGGDKLLVALCEWVSKEMPREVLPNRDAVAQRLDDTHAWAVSNVENYYEEWVRFYVGDHILALLNKAGDRFGSPKSDIMTPQHENTIVFQRFKTADGKMNVAFMFEDAMLLVHQDDMVERARIPLPKSPIHRPNGPHLQKLADKPVFGFDPDGPAITDKRLLRGPKNPIKYTK